MLQGFNGGDPAFGRLDKFPPIDIKWYHAVAPLVLVALTRLKIPVSTTFLVLSVFASSVVMEKMLLKSFLSFLVKKRRFFYVEQILKSFIETCSKKRGELKAELKSAKELSSDEISKITDELTKNFSSKIKLNYKHDESLIGGLVVQVGSTMVDTSIKNKLQQIENRMIEA